jgi:hypothetical protein
LLLFPSFRPEEREFRNIVPPAQGLVATFVLVEDNLVRGSEERAMDFEKVGRARLKMRLPRHRKQISDANFLAFTDLLEAYGLAAIKRDELREQPTPDRSILAEYEDLCQTLEEDVIKMLACVSPRMIR